MASVTCSSLNSIYLRMIGNVAMAILLVSSVSCVTERKNFTIFSAMRSIVHVDPIETQIQMNSIWSWSRLVPLENILLFFDDVESCSIVQNRYPNVFCRKFPSATCFNSIYNRSLIRCAFELAQKHAQTSILLFVNGDIMLDESISHSISYVAARLPEFFLVGCRSDYEIASSMNNVSPEKFFEEGLSKSRLHSTTGIDFIAFRVAMDIRMPPFLIGVYRWDNWLLSEIILRTNITLVDVTQSVLAIHQKATQADGAKPMPHSSRVGASYNDDLTKNMSGSDYKMGFIHNAHQALSGNCQKGECSLKINLHRSEQILIMQRANANKYIAVLTVNSGYMPMAWNWVSWFLRSLVAFQRIRGWGWRWGVDSDFLLGEECKTCPWVRVIDMLGQTYRISQLHSIGWRPWSLRNIESGWRARIHI